MSIRRWSALLLAPLLVAALGAGPAGAAPPGGSPGGGRWADDPWAEDPWAGMPAQDTGWTADELQSLEALLTIELDQVRDRLRSRRRQATTFLPERSPATRGYVRLLIQIRRESAHRRRELQAGRADPGPHPRLAGIWERLREWTDLLTLTGVLRDDVTDDPVRAERVEQLVDDLDDRAWGLELEIGGDMVAVVAAVTRDPVLLQRDEAARREAWGDADDGAEGELEIDWYPSDNLVALSQQLGTLHQLLWARDTSPPVGGGGRAVTAKRTAAADRTVNRIGLEALRASDDLDPATLGVPAELHTDAAVRRARNAVDTLVRLRAATTTTTDPARLEELRRQLASTKRDLGKQATRIGYLSNWALTADYRRRLDHLDRHGDPHDPDDVAEAGGIRGELAEAPELVVPSQVLERGPAPVTDVRARLAPVYGEVLGLRQPRVRVPPPPEALAVPPEAVAVPPEAVAVPPEAVAVPPRAAPSDVGPPGDEPPAAAPMTKLTLPGPGLGGSIQVAPVPWLP